MGVQNVRIIRKPWFLESLFNGPENQDAKNQDAGSLCVCLVFRPLLKLPMAHPQLGMGLARHDHLMQRVARSMGRLSVKHKGALGRCHTDTHTPCTENNCIIPESPSTNV